MIDEKSYPNFHALFGGYLNQDSDYYGNTIKEIVACFKTDSSSEEIMETLNEIERFKNEAGENLNSEFEDLYGFNFSPVLWGYTTASFLDELKRLLSE